jgi:hypothetical protein
MLRISFWDLQKISRRLWNAKAKQAATGCSMFLRNFIPGVETQTNSGDGEICLTRFVDVQGQFARGNSWCGEIYTSVTNASAELALV